MEMAFNLSQDKLLFIILISLQPQNTTLVNQAHGQEKESEINFHSTRHRRLCFICVRHLNGLTDGFLSAYQKRKFKDPY